jgi:hypothetical protein
MKTLIITISLLSLINCDKKNEIHCDKKFFKYAKECSAICIRTIAHAYEYGKCFTKCNEPYKKEYCKIKKSPQ